MANNTEPRVQRKILVVDQDFQNRFIVRFWLLVVCSAVLAGLIIYLMCGHAVTTVFHDSRLKIMSTADFILPAFLLSSAVVIAVVGTATALIALYVSHRIAGPVYRMGQDLANFTTGDLRQNFHLRVKDEFKPLARGLNDMAGKVRKDVAALKEGVDHLEKVPGGLSPLAAERLSVIKKILDRYHV